MGQLDQKVAIVTGASRGIGKAIAETFAREGAGVVICGRKQDTLDAVAEQMRGLPGRVVARATHVGRLDELQRLVDQTNREFGRIDIVVNNAGTNIAQGPAVNMDDVQFDKMVEINLKGAFRLTRLTAPGMAARDCARSSTACCTA
jgi:NADP-dependent 3-hydroxy acid dehydrogenase YdfG